MKKNLGLCITAIGILMVAGGLIFTPEHSYNPVDSVNGIKGSAALVFTGFIVFGVGLVLFISAIPYAGEKSKINS